MPGQTSHHLRVDRDTVTKTFRFWSRGEPDREWDGLSLLAEHAPGLAPVPLRREVRDGAPTVVMTRLPGVELGEAPLTVDETRALGAALRRLFDVPATFLTGLPDRIWGASSGLEHLRTRVGEVHDTPPEAAPAVDAARAWLADRARDERVRTNPDRVLGRADGNLANVLFDGRTCRLVDFEDCGISDPAYEVADLLEHVSGRLPRLIATEVLLEAVGLTDAQVERCTDYRRLFAIYWLLMLLPDAPSHHRNPPGSLADQSGHVLRLLDEHGPSR